MTVREVYDYLLTETNKVEAPSLLLESFNYLFGKTINETCNQWWSLYEQNQLTTDNLRVLTRTATLTNANLVDNTGKSLGNFYKLPEDYWHMLPSNTVTLTKVTSASFPCKATLEYPAIKLDSPMYSGIMIDYYTRPSYKRPYLYMHEFQHSVTTGGTTVITTYEVEIKSGDDSIYKPTTLKIDYLKKPYLPNKTDKVGNAKNIYLTYEELDSDTDISQTLEFPENYCYEIINKLTALVLEQTGDPRVQSVIPLNQSMTPPVTQSR